MPGAKRVTGRDVAERAGVSRATVSYVLNDAAGQPISAETARPRPGRRRPSSATRPTPPPAGCAPAPATSSCWRCRRPASATPSPSRSPPSPSGSGELGYTALVDPVTEEVAHLERTLARAPADRPRRHRRAPLRRRSSTGCAPPGTRAVLGFGDRPLGFAPTVVFDQSRDHPGRHDPPRRAGPPIGRRRHARRSGVPVVPGPSPGGRRGRPRRQLGMTLTVVESPLDHDRVAAVVADALADRRPTRRDPGLQRRLRPARAARPRRRRDPRARGRRRHRLRQPAGGRAVHPAPHHRRHRHAGARPAHRRGTRTRCWPTGDGPDVIPVPTPTVVVARLGLTVDATRPKAPPGTSSTYAFDRRTSARGAEAGVAPAATTAWARSRRFSLANTWRTCVFTVAMLMTSSSAISEFDRPAPMRARISKLALGQIGEARELSARSRRTGGEVLHQAGQHGRGHHRLARCGTPHRVEETIGGHILEQVAHRAGPDHVSDVLVGVERRQRQHPRRRRRGDPPGCLDAVHHRHAQVHEHDVGLQVLSGGDRLLPRRPPLRRRRHPRAQGSCGGRGARGPGRRRRAPRVTGPPPTGW